MHCQSIQARTGPCASAPVLAAVPGAHRSPTTGRLVVADDDLPEEPVEVPPAKPIAGARSPPQHAPQVGCCPADLVRGGAYRKIAGSGRWRCVQWPLRLKAS